MTTIESNRIRSLELGFLHIETSIYYQILLPGQKKAKIKPHTPSIHRLAKVNAQKFKNIFRKQAKFLSKFGNDFWNLSFWTRNTDFYYYYPVPTAGR